MDGMQIFENKSIGEKYYYKKHKSGLDVYLIPKDFSVKYALFSTKYGAVDNCFRLEGEKDFTKVPDGIAHYLEHKMFDNEDGTDSFEKFAAYGADANAFTTSHMTAYLFSCTSSFKENLAILLDYVTKPYFTPQTVQKEQGIIGQEIKMYEDHPGRALYHNMLECLYSDSQAKINVAGTVESISHITADLLYSCYNTFYNLSNMRLVISGDVTMDDIFSVCDEVLPVQEPKKIVRSYNAEKPQVNKTRHVAQFEIAKPMFIIGVKNTDIPTDKQEFMHMSAAANILYSLMFGSTSPFAIDLYEKGLVNGFSASFDLGEMASYGALSGECADPEQIYTMFTEYVERVKREGFTREDFEMVKRSEYADYIWKFDSTRLPNTFTFCMNDGIDFINYSDSIKSVEYEEMLPLVNKLFRDEYYCMSVVEPVKGEKNE